MTAGTFANAIAITIVCAVGASACGQPQESPLAKQPTGACSQFNRAISRWQGRETTDCGPDLTASVELTPLGRGSLLARHRFSPPDERFQLRSDGTIAPYGRMHAHPEWQQSGFTLLPAYSAPDSQAMVLVYDPRSPQWSLAAPGPDGLRQAQTDEWIARPETIPPWSETRPGGRQLVGIGDDAVLDRNLGDGSTRIWRFIRQADGLFRLDEAPHLVGPSRDSFRRGHRLVPLGPGRLLEWLPVACASGGGPSCARYNIWRFSLEAGTGTHDPFEVAPMASGLWTDVGAGEDLLADEGHVFVWSRASGVLRAYGLDPDAADPLAQALMINRPQSFETLQAVDWTPPTQAPEIKHLVLILQDGRSFDSYFGRYCRGETTIGEGALSCEEGPACCEGIPAGAAEGCVPLDATVERSHQPNGQPGCMRAKMNGGAMDRFTQTEVLGCGHPEDVSCAGVGATAGALDAYHQLAGQGALADKFFQSYGFVEGDAFDGSVHASNTDPSTQNMLYLTAARFGDPFSFANTTLIDDELARLEIPWAIYGGRQNLIRMRLFGAPRFQDPDWYPYRELERGELESDLANGELPAVSVVLPDGSDVERSEAPGHRSDRAIGFVANLVQTIEQSPIYRENTLVLITYLTAGGHYDHARPPQPPPLTVDATADGKRAVSYGPRVPLLALGKFARRNHISHVPLEMSSIAVFMEWNWLFGRQLKQTAQPSDPRRYRDTWVNNIGSLLDPSFAVPETRR